MTYTANPERYTHMPYRRVGRSGLVLPALSLGLWHNFGDATPSTPSAPCCARLSMPASTTSTSPTTTARPTAVPKATSAACCARTCRPTATS